MPDRPDAAAPGTLYVVATPARQPRGPHAARAAHPARGVPRRLRGHPPHGDAPARARHRDRDDVVLRAQRELEGRAHPRRAARGPQRRPRLRRRHARHLGPGLPPRARRARARRCRSCRCPARAPRSPRCPCPGLPTDRFLFVGFLPPRSARASPRARGDRGGARHARLLRVAAARRRHARGDRGGPRRPRGVPLPRGDEGARGVRARRLVGPARAARRRATSVRGEIVLVVAGAPERPVAPTPTRSPSTARLAAEGRTRREAVKEAARRLGPSRPRGLPARAGGRAGRLAADVEPHDRVRRQLELRPALLAGIRAPSGAQRASPRPSRRTGWASAVTFARNRRVRPPRRRARTCTRSGRRERTGSTPAPASAATSASAWNTGKSPPSSIRPRGPVSSKNVRLAIPASRGRAPSEAERPGRGDRGVDWRGSSVNGGSPARARPAGAGRCAGAA